MDECVNYLISQQISRIVNQLVYWSLKQPERLFSGTIHWSINKLDNQSIGQSIIQPACESINYRVNRTINKRVNQ